MKWEIQWEKLLIEKLDKHGISHEKTSFNLTSDLKKYRDYDWEDYINSGQVIDLVYPKRKGAKLKLKSISTNNFPVEIGSITFYDDSIEYKKGIVCQLITKDLHYANGDTRSCLEFDQPIILINSDNLPHEVLESKTFKLKTKAKKSGCFSSILFLVLILSILISYL